jgi:DNA polymerase-1
MTIVIDGAHLAFRSYHTFPSFMNSEGYPTGMVYGFFSILNSYAIQFGGNLVIAWEGGDNWRKEIYPEYKMHREELDPLVKQAFIDVQKLCTYSGILQVKKLRYEADDLISFIVRKIGSNIRIISGDKDLIQLINSSKDILLLRPNKEKGLVLYNEERCFEEFNIQKEKIVEYLAIMGDKSDNIAGIRGLGKVKTARFINETNNPIERIKEIYPSELDKIKRNLLLVDLLNSETWIQKLEPEDIILETPDIISLNSSLHWMEIRNFNAKDIIQMLSQPKTQNILKERLLSHEFTRYNRE